MSIICLLAFFLGAFYNRKGAFQLRRIIKNKLPFIGNRTFLATYSKYRYPTSDKIMPESLNDCKGKPISMGKTYQKENVQELSTF